MRDRNTLSPDWSPEMTAAGGWYLLESGAGEPAYNMALDQALLESAMKTGQPILRFYGWTKPAATFGYFQKYTDVEKWTKLRPLIRRPTGGGLVPHDADWTYSLIVPPGAPWYEFSAEESYRRMHEWIQAAFGKMGVTTTLAPCCRRASPGQCFVGHEKHDLLWHERKVAGAAQRRSRNGLLIQGSVQPPPVKVLRADWESAMAEAGVDYLGGNRGMFTMETVVVKRVSDLVQETYSQASYNQRR